MFGIGPQEMIVVGVIAVLLFGKRLPEVARSMGKSFVEFKKGISGVEDEIHNAGRASSYAPHQDAIEDHEEASAPKFEPPKTAPQAEEQKA
jgi:sec-independent protein translocase protein TatA